MPNTADKRAQARRATRVQLAHQTAPAQTITRRVPLAKKRGKKQQTGFVGFVQRFPLATTLFFLTLVSLGSWIVYSQKLGPFAPPPPPCVSPTVRHWDKAPAITINQNKQYTATIKTAKGNIVIELQPKDSPIAVNNFVFLAQQHYYCGTYFWRVETPGQPSPINPSAGASPLSLIQGGSVAKDGNDASTTPGYGIQDEQVNGNYTPGTVAMAKSNQPNSASSQFFIDIGDESQYFSKTYQIFGHVTSGMDVVKKIKAGDAIQGITIAEK
jgi:cyclophilin family peptidyl-prolyl cis-trans isomerase